MRGQARLEPASVAPSQNRSPRREHLSQSRNHKNDCFFASFATMPPDTIQARWGMVSAQTIEYMWSLGFDIPDGFLTKIARFAPDKSRNNFQLMKWQKTQVLFRRVHLPFDLFFLLFFLLLKYENKFLTKDLKGKICNFSSTKISALTVQIRKKLD